MSGELDLLMRSGRFLLDRLNELDLSLSSDDFARDWMGHIEPAIGRFNAALAKSGLRVRSAPGDGFVTGMPESGK